MTFEAAPGFNSNDVTSHTAESLARVGQPMERRSTLQGDFL